MLIGQSTGAAGATGGRRFLVDLALGVLVLVAVGTAIAANVGGPSSPGPTAYLFGALFGALMLVRRRWPVATLLVTAVALLGYYMLSYPPIGLAVPVAAALFSATEYGRLYWAVGTAAGLLAVSTGVRIGQGDNLGFVLGLEVPTSAALMATMIALGDSLRSRRGWRAELAKQARAAELEREREAAARVEQERVRIARDLHDLMAHTISVISLHTDVAREALADDPETASRSLAAARAACRNVGEELRMTLHALRAPEGAGHAPAPGLDRLDVLVGTATEAGLDVRVRTTGTPVTLPAISDVTAYRMTQEALSNVLRHADASTVLIELDYDTDAVVIRVTDNGRGIEAPDQAPDGWGIAGMRERLMLLGGDLDIRTRPGEWFVIQARIPVRGRA